MQIVCSLTGVFLESYALTKKTFVSHQHERVHLSHARPPAT
jgi:hypothetical protein